MKTDPREHFRYPACLRCFEQPCRSFRYHYQYGGKFLFVHNAQYNAINPCPFAAASFEEVDVLLRDCGIHEIDDRLRGLLAQMTPDEVARIDKNHVIESYGDRIGRVQYLRHLWQERVFAVIRVPQPAGWDDKMREWFETTN
jgi:hypothetical protein